MTRIGEDRHSPRVSTRAFPFMASTFQDRSTVEDRCVEGYTISKRGSVSWSDSFWNYFNNHNYPIAPIRWKPKVPCSAVPRPGCPNVGGGKDPPQPPVEPPGCGEEFAADGPTCKPPDAPPPDTDPYPYQAFGHWPERGGDGRGNL
jgi:hypothetical protein